MGAAALVMACVFAVSWVRSLWITDMLWLPHRRHVTAASFSWQSFAGTHKMADLFDDDGITWHWHFCGFRYGEYLSSRSYGHLVLWFVPYWSIVIPLALLSAYLLLSKPRLPKASKPEIS